MYTLQNRETKEYWQTVARDGIQRIIELQTKIRVLEDWNEELRKQNRILITENQMLNRKLGSTEED